MPSKGSELSDCKLHKGIHYLGFIPADVLYSVIRHSPLLTLWGSMLFTVSIISHLFKSLYLLSFLQDCNCYTDTLPSLKYLKMCFYIRGIRALSNLLLFKENMLNENSWKFKVEDSKEHASKRMWQRLYHTTSV